LTAEVPEMRPVMIEFGSPAAAAAVAPAAAVEPGPAAVAAGLPELQAATATATSTPRKPWVVLRKLSMSTLLIDRLA
jgi:hypothetical protein